MLQIRSLAVVVLAAATAVLLGSGAAAAQTLEDREEEAWAQIAPVVADRIPAHCLAVTLSEVDPDWAKVESSNDRGCPWMNGFLVVQRSAAGWVLVGEEPRHPVSCPRARVTGVPKRVRLDLDLCRPRPSRNVYVPVPSGGEPYLKLVTRPRWLSVGAKGVLSRLRWRGWNRSRAVATGRYTISGFVGEPGTGYAGPVRVILTAPRACGSERRRVYTRMQIVPLRARDRRLGLPHRRPAEMTSCEVLEDAGAVR